MAASHLRGLARSAMSLGSLHATSMVLAFMVGVLLARQLGPSGYGIYGLAMAVATLVGMLTEFGLPSLAMREFAAAEARGTWGEARGLISWADRIILGISTLVLAAFFLAVEIFDFSASGSAFFATMTWAILLVPVVGLAKLRGLSLLSLGHTFAGQFAVLVVRPGLFAVALTLLWVVGTHLGPAQAMAWQVAAAAAALAIAFYFYRRLRPPALRAAAPVSRWRQWLAATLPMGMTEGLRQLQAQMAIFMLGLVSTAATVGLYRVADSAVNICLVPGTIFSVVGSPYFARLHAAGDHAGLQRIVTAVSVAIFLSVAAVSIPLGVFAQPLLILAFGPEFGASTGAFQLLLAGNLIGCIIGPSVSLANMAGMERQVTLGIGAAVVVVAAGSLLLAPQLGAFGAAFAVAAATVAWIGMLAIVVRRRIGINPTIFSLRGEDVAGLLRLARQSVSARSGDNSSRADAR